MWPTICCKGRACAWATWGRPSATEEAASEENIKSVRVHFRKSGHLQSLFNLSNGKMRFINAKTLFSNPESDQA